MLGKKIFLKKCVKPIYKLLSLWYNNLVMQLCVTYRFMGCGYRSETEIHHVPLL